MLEICKIFIILSTSNRIYKRIGSIYLYINPYIKRQTIIIAKTKRAEIENEMSKTSLFSLPFFSCICWDLNNN